MFLKFWQKKLSEGNKKIFFHTMSAIKVFQNKLKYIKI